MSSPGRLFRRPSVQKTVLFPAQYSLLNEAVEGFFSIKVSPQKKKDKIRAYQKHAGPIALFFFLPRLSSFCLFLLGFFFSLFSTLQEDQLHLC